MYFKQICSYYVTTLLAILNTSPQAPVDQYPFIRLLTRARAQPGYSDVNGLVSGYGDQRRRAEEGSQRRKRATRTSKRNQDCQKRCRALKLGNWALTWWNERTLWGGCARESLRKKSKTRNINTSGRDVPVHSTSQKLRLLFKCSSLLDDTRFRSNTFWWYPCPRRSKQE